MFCSFKAEKLEGGLSVNIRIIRTDKQPTLKNAHIICLVSLSELHSNYSNEGPDFIWSKPVGVALSLR